MVQRATVAPLSASRGDDNWERLSGPERGGDRLPPVRRALRSQRPRVEEEPPAPVSPPETASRYQPAVEQMPAMVWTTDRDLRFDSCHGGGYAELGMAPEELIGRTLYEFLASENPESPPIRAHRLALAGESVGFEQEWQGRLFQTHVEPLSDPAGTVVGCIGMALDITERKQAEEALYQEKERALVTLASIGDGVVRTDSTGCVDYLNPVAEKLTGWSTAEAVGRPSSEIFHVVDEVARMPLPDPVRRCLEEGKVVESPDHALLLGRDGREFSIRDSAAPIFDRGGRPMGVVLVFKDVTQLRGMERELIFLASHDPLTGLINRREFETNLRRAIRTARTERREHVLLYLDLDEFKVVNDTCGHLVGDELLKQVTAILRARLRRGDLLARLGGDEFGVLLEDCPLERSKEIAEEIRRTVREFRFCWRERIFEVGVSIGLVPIHGDSGDLAHVLSGADAACYVAKDRGRNCVHQYEVDDTAVAERHGEMQWVHRINRAFEDSRFRLYYQTIEPIVSRRKPTPGGGPEEDVRPQPEPVPEMMCEIFIRMLDRQGKVLAPSAFIAAAERYHLIHTLDRWVVKTALRALAEAQRREERRPLLFGVNLSGQSLSDPSFLPFVVQELAASGVDARQICFEITETAAISKLDSAMAFILRLREKGCRFVLDDFGSGLSSFAYLRDLPVDFLKIDGEFVRGMVDDRVKRALVESIHQIGHVMGIRTIAECVENRQTLEALQEIGVDYAQGYFVSRPQPLIHDV